MGFNFHMKIEGKLLECQHGNGPNRGAAIAVAKANELAEKGTGVFIFVDLNNAFNCVDRKDTDEVVINEIPFASNLYRNIYGKSSNLYYRNGETVTVIKSSSGVRQGNALSPLLFSLAIKSKLKLILDNMPACTIIAYLDDILIHVENMADADKYFAYVKEVFDGSGGFKLNERKSVMVAVDYVLTHGHKFLGSIIGGPYVHKKFLAEKIKNLKPLFSRLRILDKQTNQLLFRFCLNSKLNHLAQSLNPAATFNEWQSLNELNFGHIANLADLEELSNISKKVIMLPLSLGGLGIQDFTKISEAANLAITKLLDYKGDVNVEVEKQRVLYREMTKDGNNSFISDQPLDVQLFLKDAASPIAKAFYRVVPFDKTLKMNDKSFSTTLRYRLLHFTRGQCDNCKKDLCFLHEDRCVSARQTHVKVRHDNIVAVINNYIKAVPKNETALNPNSVTKGSNLQGDIKVTGSCAYNNSAGVLDVTVLSVGATEHLNVAKNVVFNDSTMTLSQQNLTKCNAIIKAGEGGKNGKYTIAFNLQFNALVFLQNGRTSEAVLTYLKRIGRGNEIVYAISVAMANGRVSKK